MTDERPRRDDSIRARYEQHSADGYYREFGESYRNPHEPIIGRSLKIAAREWQLDLSKVLDLAAGSGEVTIALRELGAGVVDGIDPFTSKAYEARVGRPAEGLTFADIAAGALEGRRYSLIVASFALHLCEPSRLPGLMKALARISDTLLVLTPHKRPEIRANWGWKLTQEMIVERVRSRLYAAQAFHI